MRLSYDSELYHFGIKGMKWYRRRYQNEDGTLTTAGRARYASRKSKLEDKAAKYENQASKYSVKAAKKEKGITSHKFLLESREHYNERALTKQGKAAGYKAKAEGAQFKARNLRSKIGDIDRELNMVYDGKHLPGSRMTDNRKTYEARIRESKDFQDQLTKLGSQDRKAGVRELESKMAGLSRADQKRVIKAYVSARKAYAKENSDAARSKMAKRLTKDSYKARYDEISAYATADRLGQTAAKLEGAVSKRNAKAAAKGREVGLVGKALNRWNQFGAANNKKAYEKYMAKGAEAQARRKELEAKASKDKDLYTRLDSKHRRVDGYTNSRGQLVSVYANIDHKGYENRAAQNAYRKYQNEHPNSEMTFKEFNKIRKRNIRA